MKRKRIIRWMSALGATFALIVVMLYVYSLPQPSKYGFLEGRRPGRVGSQSVPLPVVAKGYKFRAPVERVVEAARRELTADAGWTEQEGGSRTSSEDSFQVFRGNTSNTIGPYVPGATVETRMREDWQDLLDDSDWVVVFIMEIREPTLAERIRSWYDAHRPPDSRYPG
ncbi:MAG: hypothetical protein IH851_13155 [Armatimonadetes bacterium]|nr:hypothetical protein [Armatimonadota bacterium]